MNDAVFLYESGCFLGDTGKLNSIPDRLLIDSQLLAKEKVLRFCRSIHWVILSVMHDNLNAVHTYGVYIKGNKVKFK